MGMSLLNLSHLFTSQHIEYNITRKETEGGSAIKQYCDLHSHTQYSLQDGLARIPEKAHRAKELGIPALAITDHGVMYGVIEHYKACVAEGIKPIIGCEVYVAPGSRFQKDSSHRFNHLVLLAENEQGLYNLCQICTEGFGEGFYYKPRVDDEILEKYHEGIIALSACLAGRIPQCLVAGDFKSAKEAALKYSRLFGKGNFFLELQDHGIPNQKVVNNGLMRLHDETGIPLVATNDTHYVYKEDAEAHDVLLCMQQKKTLSDADRMRDDEHEYYMKSEEEMRSLFPYAPEAIDNTKKIADRCNVEIKFHETKMPAYPVPDGMSAWEYLQKLCAEGLEARYGHLPEEKKQEIRTQMEYQLGVIRKMGYVEYFLIVWDYCNWARTHGVPVGPGRGSAAGSLVTYCIGITDIDPLQYNLQFERFLNPERVSMPDIDTDFEIRGRERVIDHVRELYGKDCVCQIITFGTLAAKAVIKDTGKVLGYPYSVCDRLSKLVPNSPGMTLDRAMQESQEFKNAYEKDDDAKRIIDMAKKLEGLPKSTGTHAAGVIIGAKPISEYIPLAKPADSNDWVSQFTMTTVEELGLLKMDFLGLRTLTVEMDAKEDIRRNHRREIDFDNMQYDDPEVYAHISTGNTSGIFQLESQGMQSFMKQLKPGCIEDLIAGISLYRPGPMDYIPQYVESKADPSKIRYDCPQLEPILKPTYGCIVYQEQVTQIVRDLAGYTMGAADNIRRAMSKKKQKVIDAERQTFVYGDESRDIPGCIRNGIPEATAHTIYDHMVDFAKYAFNKSHAACYAVIAYQTAWLMHYYPVEYWAAIMTSVIGNTNKLTSYLGSAKRAGIRIQPPDITKSTERFLADKDSVLFSLAGVKGVSDTLAKQIVRERENDPFLSYEDALRRLALIGADRTAVENLIYAGALDCLGHTRKQYHETFIEFLDSMKKEEKRSVSGQLSLFDDGQALAGRRITLPDCGEYAPDEKLALEKQASGVYISGHPLNDYRRFIEEKSTVDSQAFQEDEEGQSILKEGQQVKVGGLITGYKTYTTKKMETMAFMTLEDLYGQIEVIIFPKLYEQLRAKGILKEDQKIMILGKVTIDNGATPKLIADKIGRFENINKKIRVRFEMESFYKKRESILKSILAKYYGKYDIQLEFTGQGTSQILPGFKVNPTPALLYELRQAFGYKNVEIVG